jgi:serine/threonine protein kinase/DNA-binding winged helix-turn-helix (wHTH) protein
MKNTLPLRLRFAVFELDLKSGELHKSGQRVVLQEQPLQVLRILLENAGAITTREEIQQQLWPNDTVVEFDHSINAAIKKLRVALGDSADNPKYIETIARRGYRLMVPVERLGSTAGDASGPGVVESSHDGPGIVSSSHDGTGVQPQLETAGLTGKTVSHYRVLEVVGGGGMGVVYKAEDLKLGRAVALKFLPEEVGDDPRALERFEREARAASSLDHSNICSIYEFGEHDTQPFIVMQLLQGQTLRDCLASGALKDTASRAQISLDRLLDIGIQVANGLEAAHEQGIIHRDIKPANIFITTKGVAKILDFGLAKLPLRPSAVQAIPAELGGKEGLNLSRPGRAAGTAAYMSPEQARGQQLDARTDLFSFGLILYEMATGQRAFTGDSASAVQEAIVSRAPTPPAELNPELPTELQGVIQKCLAKDRDLRCQSAAEIRSDLEKVKRRREHPLLNRWRLLTTAAVVVVALLAGGLYWHSRNTISLTGKDTLVLADFVNTTGDAVFDDALSTALLTEFQQSPYLNLLSPDKVSRILKQMNQPGNARLTPALAREVCLRTNSKL